MKTKITRKRILIAVFSILLLGVSLLVFAGERDQSTPILGKSNNIDTNLGASGDMPDESTELASKEDELVYYQFQQEEDTVTLALAGDVSKVVLIEPEGKKQEDRKVLGADTLSLGYSIKSSIKEETRQNFKVKLGESQESEEKKALEIRDEQFFEEAVKTEFIMVEEGAYQFALYNKEEELITKLDYAFLRLQKGEAKLSYVAGTTNINVLGDTTIILNYNPVANTAEELYLHLPPYFELVKLPTSSTGVTFNAWTPAENSIKFYEDAVNGNKMLNILEEKAETSNSYKWQHVFSRSMQISISDKIDQPISLSFTIRRSSSYLNTFPSLLYYMNTDMKNMPMLVAIESGLDGGVDNGDILYGNSLFEEADPALEFTYPQTATNSHNLSNNPPQLKVYNYIYPVNINQPHYPVGDIRYLMRYSDGMKIDPSNPPFTHADGFQYIEQKNSKESDFEKSLMNLTKEENRLSLYYMGDGLLRNLESPTYFKGGEVMEFGDAYIRYNQYGIEKEELFYTETKDFVVPMYGEKMNIGFQTKLDPTASWVTSNANWRMQQGITYEGLYIRLNNHFTTSYLPSVYLDASYHVQFPYEISPEEVRLNVYQSGEKPEENTLENYPFQLRYKVHGSSQEYVIPIAPTDKKVAIPQTYGRISDVFLDHENIYVNTATDYFFTLNINTKDVDGNALDNEHEVFIKTNILTEDGNRVEGQTSDSPLNVPISDEENTTHKIILEGEGEDSVAFGTVTYYQPTSNLQKPYDKSIIHTGNTGRSENYGERISSNVNTSYSPWHFGFVKLDTMNKNYDEIIIDITPKTEEDKKALSKVNGVRKSPSYGESFKADLLYTTNAYPTERSVNVYWEFQRISLEEGEYLTGLKISIRDINGAKMRHGEYTPEGELLNTRNTSYAEHFALTFEDSPNYFNGTAEQVRVKDFDSFNLVATATTSDGGRYITPGNPEFKNNTSNGQIVFRDHTKITANLTTANATMKYKNNGLAYLGNILPFEIRTPVKLRQPSVSTEELKSGSTIKGLEDFFEDPKTELYIEVKEDIDVLSVPGFTRKNVEEFPDKGTKLYAYKINYPTTIKSQIFDIDLYIRPMANIGQQEAIVGFGFSYEDLIASHTPTTGDDAYYHQAPYFDMTYVAATPFPDHWNIPVASGTGTSYYDYSGNNITVNHAQVDGIDVIPGAGGSFALNEIKFKEHQKDPLEIRGSISNSTAETLNSYTMRMELPRVGGKTTNGQGESFDNEFNIFLQTPLNFPDRTDAIIVYYDSNDNILSDIDENSTLSELAQIKYVDVSFTEFQGETSLGFDAEFRTDKIKHGAETEDIFSYIGFASKKIGVGGETDFAPATPAKYTYQSYTLMNYYGMDPYHIGNITYATRGAIEVTVVALLEDGSDEIVYQETSSSAYSLKIPMNLDVYKIIIKTNAPDKFSLTAQNQPGVSATSQSHFATPNFPNDTSGVILVKKEDIMKENNNKYNGGFLEHINVTLPDIVLEEGTTAEVKPVVKFKSGYNVSASLLNYSTHTYTDTVNDGVATIDSTGLVTAVANGETTYTYTIKTRVGYTVTATGKIRVAPSVSDFNVNVIADNVWLPHGSPVVFVKAEGLSDTNLGREFYKIVKLDGGTNKPADINTTNARASKSVTFEQVPNGDYKISVIPVLRFSFVGAGNQTVTIEDSTTVLDFQLKENNYAYLSDTDKGVMEFSIT